jgi:hypothetical protein
MIQVGPREHNADGLGKRASAADLNQHDGRAIISLVEKLAGGEIS